MESPLIVERQTKLKVEKENNNESFKLKLED